MVRANRDTARAWGLAVPRAWADSQIDGEAKAVALSEDESKLLIGNELLPFKCFIEDEKTYVELPDGRKLLQVNSIYE